MEPKTRSMVPLLAALLAVPVAAQTSPQAAGMPPMGWNSWNWFGKQEINEGIVQGVIDALATSGLKDAGYEYVVIDGGWRNKELGPANELLADPGKFPHGIKALADRAHSRGLKLGLHTVPGTHDCGGDKVGGYGHEQTHLRQFVEWGVDFIKLDQCILQTEDGWNEQLTQKTYANWHQLLDGCGRDIVLSISAYRFRAWYPAVCRMARTTPDISCRKYRGANFDQTQQGVMPIALLNDKSAAFAGNGYWNDPDILVVGEQGLNLAEQQTHFALWCIMTAPLMLGNDPRNMQPNEKAILLNRECIAVDQDPTEQGRRIKVDGDLEIWAKHLAGGRVAALLVNRHATATKTATVTWQNVGMAGTIRVRDIYQKKDIGDFGESFQTEIAPHGCAFLLLAPAGKNFLSNRQTVTPPAGQRPGKPIVYQNPIVSAAIEGGIRDPSIINWGNKYYLTGTAYPFSRGARTGVRLWSSDDLKDWKSEGPLIDSSSLAEDVWYRDTFWANEIHVAKGKFWLTFNAANMSENHKSQHSCGLAVAAKITGPYTVLTPHKSLLGGNWGNDMTLFTDDDGKTYAYWKSHWVQELDLENAKLVGQRFPTLPNKVAGTWEHIGIEGSFVIKRRGVYYMFYSSWSRGYEVGYATAPRPTGPWTKYPGNPIYGAQNPESCQKNGLPYTGNPDSPFLGAGHCSIFTGPDGRDWIAAHCTYRDAKSDMDRYLLVYDPIMIDKDGIVHAHGPTWTRQGGK